MYCVSLQEASELARSIYPDLRDVPFVFPDQGYENFTMMTQTEVIRLARHEAIADSMDLEVQTLQAINGGLCLATPFVHDFNPEYHIIRMSRLPGTPLLPYRLAKLSYEEREHLAGQLSHFLIELHEKFSVDRSFLRDAFKSYRIDGMSKLELFLGKNIDEKLGLFLHRVRDYILNFEDHSDDATRIHGDLIPSNILYDQESSKLSIVDFTLCRQGYRHQDFRRVMRSFPADFSRAMMGHYESVSGRSVSGLAYLWHDLVKVAEYKSDMPETYVIDNPMGQDRGYPYTFPALQDLPVIPDS